LATPGTPSSRQCPPASSAVSSRSTSRSCPTIDLLDLEQRLLEQPRSVSSMHRHSSMGPFGSVTEGGKAAPGLRGHQPKQRRPGRPGHQSGTESGPKEGILVGDVRTDAGARPAIRGPSKPRAGNGLRVVVSEDRSAPVVCVNLWYDVGSRHEPPGQTGFAHLFEHLMFEGRCTSRRPSTCGWCRATAAR
jgi:hypothetical protein